jgi:signal transduction histidine kinase
MLSGYDPNTIDLLEKSISEIRNISHDLLPEELKNKELKEAVEKLCSKYDGLKQFQIKFKSSPIPQLQTNTKKHIYRIVQELLSNGIKHSQADKFQIGLKSIDNQLVLSYHDNGKGISGKVLELSTGIGWRNILARLEILSGKVSLDNSTDGTQLSFKFPI